MLKFEFYHFRRGEGARTTGGRRRRFQLRIDFYGVPNALKQAYIYKEHIIMILESIYYSLCVYHVEAGIQPFSGVGGKCSSGLNFFVGSQIT